MNFYEITFILRQDVQPQEVDAKVAQFTNLIQDNGGAVIRQELWGLRSLAYEVRKNKKGHYVMLVVEASGDLVKELERNFKISEDVIKFATIRTPIADKNPSFIMQAKDEKEKRAN